MRICSHQPSLFPWLGYWNKVANCDVIIMSCGVKFNHHNFQNRVQMLGTWLTLPVQKGAKHLPIRDVQLVDGAVRDVHHRIRQELCGKRNPGHRDLLDIIDHLDSWAGKGPTWLMEYNLAAFEAVNDFLGLQARMVMDMTVPNPGMNKTQRLVARVLQSTGNPDITYLGGGGMLEYFTPEDWPQDWKLEVQETPSSLDKNTLLQLIAQDADVIASVKSACTWRVMNVREEGFGNRTAFG